MYYYAGNLKYRQMVKLCFKVCKSCTHQYLLVVGCQFILIDILGNSFKRKKHWHN